VQQVLRQYGERYFEFKARQIYEKLREQGGIGLIYTWVRLVVQAAGGWQNCCWSGVRCHRLTLPVEKNIFDLTDATRAIYITPK
jgi:hypothetical protein